jgi:hypothetical protein
MGIRGRSTPQPPDAAYAREHTRVAPWSLPRGQGAVHSGVRLLMRQLWTVLIVTCAAWAVDVLAFDGRYSRTIWQQAAYHGQQFGSDVKRWLDRGISGLPR